MSWYKQPPTVVKTAGAWRAGSLEEARKSLLKRNPVEVADEEPAPTPPPPDPVEVARAARAEGLAQGLAEGRAEGLEEGRQEGLAQGLAEGREKGRDEAYAEHQAELDLIRQKTEEEHVQARGEFIAELRAFVDESYRALREWKDETARVHTHFALEVARRAVAHELKLSRESAVALAKDALAELHQGVEFRILVSPADVNVVEGHRQEITEMFSQIRGLEVVPDRNIRGGVVIESQSGTIDARIEAYLQRMAEAALRSREAA